jgi:predicted GIY-YIG superfamily endonuclease
MSAYVISNRNGWMCDISKHMISNGNRYLRCIYSYEFSDNHVYIGLTYNIKEREINRKSHINDAVTKHKLATGLIPKIKILSDYIDVNKASILEGAFVEKYKNDGWIILNTKPTGGIGGNILIWNKENCIEAAMKCKTRTEFHKKYRGAYSSAVKNNWIDEINNILKSNKGGKQIHNLKSCKKKAILCTSVTDFKNKYPKEYSAAYRNNWLNEFYK